MATTPPNLADAFGLGDQEPEQPVTPPAGPTLLENLNSLRAEQDRSMSAHSEYSQRTRDQMNMVSERQQDLEATRQFLTLSDPNVPKPARAFMWRQFAASMGADPKSPAVREFGQLLTQLDPDSLGALRGSIVEASSNAQSPNAMRGLFRATLRGEIPAEQLFTRVADFAQRRAGQSASDVAQSFGPGDTTRVPTPSNTERPAIHQEVDPGLIAVLPGMEAGQRLRLGELQSTFPNLPSDAQGQRDLAKSIREKNAKVRTFLDEANELMRLVDRQPSLLGPVGTGAQYWESFRQQIASGMGLAADALPDATSPAIRRFADKMTNEWMRSGKIENTADARAQFNARLIRLGYAMLQSNEPGGRFTEQDIIRNMQQIGASADPSQMRSALTATVGNVYRAYQQELGEATGGEMGLPIDRLPSTRIAEIGQNPLMPLELRRQAALIWKARGMDRQPEMREAAGKPGTEVANEPAAATTPPQRQGEVAPQRRPSSIEQEEAGLRQRANTAEALLQETQRLNQLLAVRRDARDQSQEDRAGRIEQRQETWRREDQMEKAQAKLQAALQQFARSLGGSAPNIRAGGGSGGGDQDSRAFQLPQRPRKQAPAIPQVGRRGR